MSVDPQNLQCTRAPEEMGAAGREWVLLDSCGLWSLPKEGDFAGYKHKYWMLMSYKPGSHAALLPCSLQITKQFDAHLRSCCLVEGISLFFCFFPLGSHNIFQDVSN